MINGQSLYWQIYETQDNGAQSLESLISQDLLEKLLEVKTISFEIRSENQIVLDYLVKQNTLKRLMKHIFVASKTESTDRAIEVFGCAEALRNVFSSILATPELIAAPFEALAAYTQAGNDILPATLAPPHIYQGFHKLFSALLMSPKRVQSLVQFLVDNPKHMRTWTSHMLSSQMTEVLRSLVLDYKGRGDDTCKQISALLKNGIIDALAQFIITDAPLECVSNSCQILSQIVSQNVPYLQEIVITKITPVCTYLMNAQLVGSNLLRLHYAADFVVCGLSFMMQRGLSVYIQQENQLQKITYDVLQKRTQFVDQLIKGKVKLTVQNQKILELPVTGINEIDAFEKVMVPVFASILNSLEQLCQRVDYMREQAKNNLFGYGTFVILQFVARILAISADLKLTVQKQMTLKSQNKPVDWLNQVEDSQTSMVQPDSVYAQLSLAAHAGSGGPSTVEISSTFKHRQVPLITSVVVIVRKIIQTGLVQKLVDFVEQFESNSNLHFVASRIFVPLVEFGDSAPDITLHLLKETTLITNMCRKLDQFIPFKSRTSLQTYYISFARSFLRIALKLPDESSVEDKQKFVAGKTQQVQQAPQHLSATIKIYGQTQQPNQIIYEFLTQSEVFKTFSSKCLEYEDEIPKTFGDARLTAEYQAQKKQKKKTQGVFDTGFGAFGGFQQNDFFGFGNQNQGWGDMGKKEDNQSSGSGFGFGWGDFQ
ncbi:Phosphorylase_B kinase gamma catalytic chain [Hexamita inflata]|uniref:Phosphorylase B kinase gamma catalytic chain n=1 Tax=Hexamita inflata TaxID=28002 RepID=A0AA86QXL8_9EUKA|nr:Phosphorylase B kinase gamma catalytic chain [Hexamita inflata]